MEFAETMSDLGKIKRIAVCLSGNFRTWKTVVKTWDNVIKIDNVEVDYFIHTWDKVSPSMQIIGNLKKTGITDEEILKDYYKPLDMNLLNEVLDYHKPVSYLIESPKDLSFKNPKQSIFEKSHLSQFFGIMMAGKLKREHEIKNDFTYDLVIRMRFDTYFTTPIIIDNIKPKLNTVYGNHYDYYYDEVYKRHNGRLGDIFWCSDSLTYDILSDFYLELQNITDIPHGTPPEFSWLRYIKKNGINITPNPRWDLHILRENDTLKKLI
jgi:hypothetical protein